jgi:hypothetical protein
MHSGKEEKNCFRVIFWNCGGFPSDRTHPKNHMIRNIINDTQADVVAIAETNLYWKLLNLHDRLNERTRGWFKSLHISLAYPFQFPATTSNLAGGTAVLTINDCAHRVSDRLTDCMGRWASTCLRGHNHQKIQIVSAYRCVKNIYGPLSTWNQQRY